MTANRAGVLCALFFLADLLAPSLAGAEDTLKVAIGQRGNWETGVAELGQRAGIFKKHGLILENLFTNGSGETLQAVVAGGADIGVGTGTGGVMAACLCQRRAGTGDRLRLHRRP
jgi:NitT/TauT family transport system substrate-binding protein